MHTSPAGGKIEFTARIRYSWKTFRAFRSPRMTGGASIELRESAARYSWNSSEIEPGPRITFPSKAAPPCYKSGIVYLSIASRYVQQVWQVSSKKEREKEERRKKKTLRVCFWNGRFRSRFRESILPKITRTIPWTRGNGPAKRKQFYRGTKGLALEKNGIRIFSFELRGRRGKKGEEKCSILSVRILRGSDPVIPAGLRNSQENPPSRHIISSNACTVVSWNNNETT